MSKKLKSLAEHNSTSSTVHWNIMNNRPVLNGIECPTCGKELFDSSPMTTLTSMPPQKNVHCDNCKYTGYRIA